MKWSRAKASGVLPTEHTGHSKHPLPTTQEMTLHMDITRWSTPKSDWLYSLQPKMEKLYTVSKNKTRSWMWLRSWTPYCQIQTSIEESRENHLTIQVWKWKWSRSVVSNSLRPNGLYSPSGFSIHEDSPGKNTEVGSLSLLQGIFPTHGLNRVSCIAGRFFTNRAIREAPY